jgi:hypothetical protein
VGKGKRRGKMDIRDMFWVIYCNAKLLSGGVT